MRPTRGLQSAVTILVLLMAAGLAMAQSSITTNKPDYSPGETVYITGFGFAPGEVVQLTIYSSEDTRPPVSFTSAANSTGSFVNSSYVVSNSDAGQTLTVIAKGMSSNRTAMTTFTDATALLYAYADAAGTICLNRRSDGRFLVSPGQTIYLQVKGSATNPLDDKRLTSLSPAETSIQVTWRAPNGFIHKITFLRVPVTGTTPTDRATALIPWKVGDFTIAGNTGLPGATMVSAAGAETTQTLLTPADVSGIIYCTLPVFYGNISNNEGLQTMNPPSLPTCASCLQQCGADQPLGALAWQTQSCLQGCPSSLTLVASPASPVPGQTVTFSVVAPEGYAPAQVNWTVDGVADRSSTGLTLSKAFTTTGPHAVTASVVTSPDCVKNLSIAITIGEPTPPSATCMSIRAIQGVAITPVTMMGSGGAGGPYTFSATGLPAGLTMSPSGTIFGTPTATGTFNYSVIVTDKNGNTGTVNCSLTVLDRPTASCISINAALGVPLTPVKMTGSGGAGGPYTFSANGLPSGVTMAADGTISGTPTATGTFNYTVTVRDSVGNTGSINCLLTVQSRPTASCVVISAVKGVAITPVQLTGSGGAGGPYTFTATGLPAGLTISSSGVISGTPTVSGTFSYTVTITDKSGAAGTLNCSVTVTLPPPSAACTLTQGYWKNHDEEWPVSALVLGGKTYTEVELLALLDMPTVGDSSLTLAKQLIAAKLNAANGANPSIIVQTAIAAGDALLAADPDRLPLGVRSISMEVVAATLDAWNNGKLGTPYCSDSTPPPVNTASIGDRVWKDEDRDGVQESGEPGLNGVTVQLRRGSSVVATRTTSGNGVYFFGSLPAATYTVCTTAGVPNGFAPTYDLDGLDTPRCATVTVAAGEARADVDFGYALQPPACTGTIGDFVWADDGDGIQETSEAGIGGVTVKLYNALTHALISTTVTASNGSYRFSNLCAGFYKVEAIAPSGKQSTIANAPGSTSAKDSNTNPAVVTLSPGETDLTVDFGFRPIPPTGGGCTYTQGHWKNHDDDWPVQSLRLGARTYSRQELRTIFRLPVRGDSSIPLAHQLIAAKLNAANQALVPSVVGGFIAQADSLLSQHEGQLPLGVSSGSMETLTSNLDTYNNGGYGATHCR